MIPKAHETHKNEITLDVRECERSERSSSSHTENSSRIHFFSSSRASSQKFEVFDVLCECVDREEWERELWGKARKSSGWGSLVSSLSDVVNSTKVTDTGGATSSSSASSYEFVWDFCSWRMKDECQDFRLSLQLCVFCLMSTGGFAVTRC